MLNTHSTWFYTLHLSLALSLTVIIRISIFSSRGFTPTHCRDGIGSTLVDLSSARVWCKYSNAGYRLAMALAILTSALVALEFNNQ